MGKFTQYCFIVIYELTACTTKCLYRPQLRKMKVKVYFGKEHLLFNSFLSSSMCINYYNHIIYKNYNILHHYHSISNRFVVL